MMIALQRDFATLMNVNIKGINMISFTKKMLLVVGAVSLSSGGFADGLVGGVGYHSFDADGEVDLSIAAFTLGWEFGASTSNYSTVIEARAGVGVSDDSLRSGGVNIKAEIDQFYGIVVRGQWEFDNNAYFYLAPSYTDITVKASARGVSVDEDDTVFGAAIGVGYNFTDAVALELSYENIDDSDLLGLSFRYSF